MAEALQFFLLALVTFVLALGLVVFVHEYGHFSAARLCRIAVKSFSIGFGPALASRKDRHGTTWKVGAIPLGGFVSWVDDTDPSSTAPPTAEFRGLSQAEARARGHFRAQPLGARAFVVAAGPVMNFIFAILVFATIALIAGRDATNYGALAPRIGAVNPEYPAAAAGLKTGDLVVSINGRPIRTFGEMQSIIVARPEQRVAIVVRRDGEELPIAVTPRSEDVIDDSGVTSVEGRLGVGQAVLPSERRIERYNVIEALGEGMGRTWLIVARTGAYVSNIFAGRASPEHIAGPLGIFTVSGQVATMVINQEGVGAGERIIDFLYALVQWAALLSVAVGIVNLLPIPILDGGHLLFYGIEAVRGGRPLSPQAQEWALRLGLAALGSLFLFATWNDIRRIFG